MIGRPRVHLRRTDSTNERARALALAPEEERKRILSQRRR